MIAVTILGNNSALPAYDRHPTAQVVTVNDQLLLIDCGEGTQNQIARYKIRRSRINHIFISHLHGDHYFGVAGLITSLGLLGREHALHLYAPPGLEEILSLQLKVANTRLPFELVFHPLTREMVLTTNAQFEVSCFRVNHRIACWGFKVQEKRNPRRLLVSEAARAGVPFTFYERLQQGEDYTNPSGITIANSQVTTDNSPGLSYAYCADTCYMPELKEVLQGVHTMYHETTYLKDQEQKAAERFHSTTEQAAMLARASGVHQLLIGHFSSRYEKLEQFLSEAQEIFPSTMLALEGITFTLLAAPGSE